MYCCLDLLISSLSKRNIFTKYKFSCTQNTIPNIHGYFNLIIIIINSLAECSTLKLLNGLIKLRISVKIALMRRHRPYHEARFSVSTSCIYRSKRGFTILLVKILIESHREYHSSQC